MNKPAYIVTENAITVIWEGKPYTVNKDNPNYQGLRNALFQGDYTKLGDFLDIKRKIADFFHGNIKIVDEQVYYCSHLLHGVVIEKLLEFLRAGMDDAKPILNFIEKLMTNPSKNSVDQLYTFLSYKSLPLTAEGNVIAYKGVRDDYFSKNGNTNTIVIKGIVDDNGHISNKVGCVIEVARNNVDDNKDNHCSYGLHVGSYDYARDWASSDGRIMMVEFDPADAVSVPTDYSFQKLRVCRYKVIGEIPIERKNNTEAPLSEPYYDTDSEIPLDDEESCSDDCGCNINEGYNYADTTILAVKNYVEGRVDAGSPPTIRQIKSRLKGIHITSQDIVNICDQLDFTIERNDDVALCDLEVTIED